MGTVSKIEIIEKALQDSYTYGEYKELVGKLLNEGKSTGPNQSEDLLNYSMLNDRRMKRWDKTVKLEPHIIDKVSGAVLNVTWLLITEGWCGDAAHALPVLNRIAELNKGIDLKLVLRDDHEELMQLFLTNGSKSIPKLIIYDNDKREVLHTWGPRPSEATKLVNDYKAEHGSLDPVFKQELQMWYNKNKGKNIADDISELI
ncbi:MAG: thioredoxin family protein [Aquimarina sp.]|nr:thioredoxin family protein [Aquimarina sp.]